MPFTNAEFRVLLRPVVFTSLRALSCLLRDPLDDYKQHSGFHGQRCQRLTKLNFF